MSLVDTLPVRCRYCGEEIERPDIGSWWVDVRLSSEGGEHEHCPNAPYSHHLPDRPELTV